MSKDSHLELVYSAFPSAPKVYLGKGESVYIGRDIAASSPELPVRRAALVAIMTFGAEAVHSLATRQLPDFTWPLVASLVAGYTTITRKPSTIHLE